MNRKYMALLEETMRRNMDTRSTHKFQEAYNIYIDEIGLGENQIKVDGLAGEQTMNAAKWLRGHIKWLDEEEAWNAVQDKVVEDRLEFYRNWEFTKPSDTLDVKEKRY